MKAHSHEEDYSLASRVPISIVEYELPQVWPFSPDEISAFMQDHAPELLSMAAALSSMGIVNLLSGCLLGAQLVVDVGLVYAQHQLRRFALRSDHALLHKVAANFNPKHAAAGGVSYVVALMGLASQLRRGAGPLSFPIKVVSVCFFFVCSSFCMFVVR